MKVTPSRIAIFGATSDIATQVARQYAEAGACVVLVGRNTEALTQAAADLRVRGAREVIVHTADFAVLSELPTVAQMAWQSHNGLDLALIAYGSLPEQSVMQISTKAAEAALGLNFTSPALLAGELATKFEAQGSGTIAVITSVAGDRGRGSNYVYGAAKGGLQRFLEGLRHRLSRANVGVLDIRPGFVSTKMTNHLEQAGPLWAKPDRVASDILAAIDGRKSVLYTPWFWRFILMIVRTLPRPLFHRSSL